MTCRLVGSAHGPHATLVNHNLVRPATGKAHKGYLLYLVLHHPLEVTTQKAIDEEDVKGSLMVGYKDVRLIGFQILTAFHLYGQQEGTNDSTSPPATWIVAPIMSIAQRTADTHKQSRPDSHQNGDRKGHKNLIDAVENPHDVTSSLLPFYYIILPFYFST